MEKYGFNLFKKAVLALIGWFVMDNNIKNIKTKYRIPSKVWFLGSARRHLKAQRSLPYEMATHL